MMPKEKSRRAEGSGEVVPFYPSVRAQAISRYTSEILWHFVSRQKSNEQSYETLISIVRTGLRVGKERPRVIFYRQPDGSTSREELYGYPVSCLADIPFKDLPLHMERYGQFAIGFRKVNAIYFGFHPVLYLNQFSSEFLDFMRTLNEVGQLVEGQPTISEKYEHLRLLLGTVVKAGWLQMAPHRRIDLEDQQLQNFYYGREWRCARDWEFQSTAVGAVLLPDKFIARFKEDQAKGGLKVAAETLVVPSSMVLAL